MNQGWESNSAPEPKGSICGKAQRSCACLKSLLRWSFKAPFLSEFKPDAPCQSGPDPTKTTPTVEYLSDQPRTTSSSIDPENWPLASTALWALADFSSTHGPQLGLWEHPELPAVLRCHRIDVSPYIAKACCQAIWSDTPTLADPSSMGRCIASCNHIIKLATEINQTQRAKAYEPNQFNEDLSPQRKLDVGRKTSILYNGPPDFVQRR